MNALPDFTTLPDLASRRLGGGVVAANDELFAEKENLINPSPPVFASGDYGHKGKVYDGWETRRRRDQGHDYAIVRLGVPGVVRGVVVDTSFFRGNFPPRVSVEGLDASSEASPYPSPAELVDADWRSLVPVTDAFGDTVNAYPVTDLRRCTHVRLSIYPDGGVARLRVHGVPVPDPVFLAGTIDLAALENGGQVIDCSDAFYGSAANLIMPGLAAGMADGWENARRRGAGNDYVTLALAGAGVVRYAEIDTSHFVGNAPGSARLLAATAEFSDEPQPVSMPANPAWRELLSRVRLQPDTRHRFLVADTLPCTHIRLEVFPDGGVARLRLHGELTPAALTTLGDRYQAMRA